VGYVEQYKSSKRRSQVIIVMTEDFTVLCYDHLLSLLWEKSISHNTFDIDQSMSTFQPYEIAIMPSSLQVQRNMSDSSGTIFIGISMRPAIVTDPSALNCTGDGCNKKIEEWEKQHLSGLNSNIRSQLEHFNIYALDSSTGHIIWKHDGLDVKPEQYTKSLPRSSMFKLELKDLMTKSHHGGGLSDWTLFREALISHLPHYWQDMSDTYFEISSFSPKHFGSSVKVNRKPVDQKSKFANKQSRFSSIMNNPVPFSALLPHDSSEHINHPNVLVAHTSRGLEVVSLSSGLAITSLALQKGYAFADIDGDTVVDTIMMHESSRKTDSVGESFQSSEFANPGSQFERCSIIVVSGLPPKSQLFNGTICARRNSLQEPMQKHRSDSLPERVSSTVPVVIRTVGVKGKESKNIIVATNTGVITSYSGAGDLKWQSSDSPKWDINYKNAYTLHLDIDSKRVLDVGSHDSIEVDILVVGETSLKIFSSAGDLLSTVEIPEPVVSKPVLGDFDSDGITDIVLTTEDSIMGYRLEVSESTNVLFFAFVILFMITLLVFLANIKLEALKGPSKASVISILRSTDNLHTD
jgi:hypothetical protein